MEKLIYNLLSGEGYVGLVTILDYEISLRKCLSEIDFSSNCKPNYKIVVDLALKSGINKYRFVEYEITDHGDILWGTSSYIIPNNYIVKLANSFLVQKKELLYNSMLPSTVINNLINEHQ